MPAAKKSPTPKKNPPRSLSELIENLTHLNRADRDALRAALHEEDKKEHAAREDKYSAEMSIKIKYWNNGEINRPIEYEMVLEANHAFSQSRSLGKTSSTEMLIEALAHQVKRKFSEELDRSIEKEV